MNDFYETSTLSVPFREILAHAYRITADADPELAEGELAEYRERLIVPQLAEAEKHPKFAGLCIAADQFRSAFLDLIRSMEQWLYIKMPDFNDELAYHNISREDAFDALPGYFDSCRILGKEYDPVYCFYRSPETNHFSLEEIAEIMIHCRSAEAEASAKELGIEPLRAEAVQFYDTLQAFVKRESLQELLDTVWECCSILAILALKIKLSDMTTFHSKSRSPRYIKMKEVLVPILERREFQEKMEEFSSNDLQSREFLRYAEQLLEKAQGDERYAYYTTVLAKQTAEYRRAVEPFEHSPFSDQFMNAEKEWYQAVDLFYMTMFTPRGIVSIFEHDDLVEDYRNSIYITAEWELAELVYGEECTQRIGQDRGDAVYHEEWAKIRDALSCRDSREPLEILSAANLFDRAVKCEQDADTLAALICSPEALCELRDARSSLSRTTHALHSMMEFMDKYDNENGESE